ncbi:MAG TPA: Lrp/AsnC family transcriptional regulator [Segeticoccus sp.]|uniref:Lrp/AsnC family transcriptional regulator n=1 Tax=Segeticoccus sp. TaxID=2706531 RepID=UPI002D80E729|nr:Lrp/AsnC family transcriptional regulator [Segeticoccus sp.]HET8599595.1 Lrp/AsnC family transcriptional regulator [Segeticoccus sp.]
MKVAHSLDSAHRPTLGERDLALIHALQIAPRISWAEAARVLDATPQSLAQRWSRLRDEGLAWVTVHPAGAGDEVIAMVEVDCLPGERSSVARALCADPRVASVEEAARGCDLLLTIIATDLTALSRFVLDDLGAVEGVANQRSYLATSVHRQGSSWRLRALDGSQRAALEAVAHRAHIEGRRPGAGHAPMPVRLRPIVQELARDGRATAADLARATGRNPATVRRQLATVIASGRLAFRCEVAQEHTRWPIVCNWQARVPTAEHDRTARALATLPELRLCLTTTGEANLYFTVWAESLPDLLRIERLLAERLPWLELRGSTVTLRQLKRMGWLLHPDSRCTGEVVAPEVLYA